MRRNQSRQREQRLEQAPGLVAAGGGAQRRTQKMAELSLLTAAALVIALVELQFPNPFPLPGIKLGLANIVTVYAIYHYRAGEVALLLLVRIALTALLSGNLMALAFSLGGGVLCLAGMLALRSVVDEDHLWLSSVLGAILHNIGQLAVALLLTQTLAVAAYLPFLLVAGCLAGAFTGGCAQLVNKRLRQALAK